MISMRHGMLLIIKRDCLSGDPSPGYLPPMTEAYRAKYPCYRALASASSGNFLCNFHKHIFPPPTAVRSPFSNSTTTVSQVSCI